MKTVFALASFLFLTAAAHAELKVFSCEPEWASLVTELGGEHVTVYTATTALQDPHHIEARPSLIARMRTADLLICTGAGLEEGWLPLVIRQAANEKILPGNPGHFLAAMQVERLNVPQQVDRSMGDVHPEGNPHVHLDPHRIAVIAKTLNETMIALDRENADYFQQRHKYFAARWQSAIAQWEQQAHQLRGKSVVSYHTDWIYLYEWLGMKSAGTLEPKPGIAPSAGYLAELQAALRKQPAAMVVYASYQNDKAARWLSAEMQMPLVELPYTVGANAQSKDLFGLYADTVQRLLTALDKHQ